MRALCAARLCLLLSLAATPLYAQTPPAAPESIKSSLIELLSLTTLGTVAVQDQGGQVTQSGADYLVRLPLKDFSAPPDAALEAVARPLDGGMWDVTSMTLPPAGTIQPETADAPAGRITYSIGEQSTHAQIDPHLAHPSSFATNLGGLRVRIDQGDQHSDQTFDRYVVDGTLSTAPSGRLTLMSHGKGNNWSLTSRGPKGFETSSLVRSMSGHVAVEELDRAQATRLLVAARALIGATQASAPGEPPSLSSAQRENLRGLVDASSGLLGRFEAEQVSDDIRFTIGPSASGTLGHMRVDLTGGTTHERLDARMDLAMDDFAVTSLPAETAGFVPHHIAMTWGLRGIRTDPLLALLHDATEPAPDPVALQARFMALLADPDARVGIEQLSFDSGPVQVTGFAHLVPRANGQIGAEIHLSATGMDALVAQAQTKPALQQALPMMFMAKGMGRPVGNAVVWDITFGDGPITVNGVPFGQPTPRKR